MTREWFTAAELADMALPDIPHSRVGVTQRATRQGWVARPRAGRGGGREFHYAALPPRARAVLLRRQARKAMQAAEALTTDERARLLAIAEDLGRLLAAVIEELRQQ